jgi:hypothetical protein
MAFVKLDTGILNSTLWVERECREVFITSLLMAEPREFTTPQEQIEVRSLALTGFAAPPGWYGFVEAAGIGIIRRAMVDQEAGLCALEKLGATDPESRSKDFDGRRLIRIDGGYLVLNFMKYRDRDYTGALRAQRYRDRKKAESESNKINAPKPESRGDSVTSHRDITQAEAEAEKEKKDTRLPSVGSTRGFPPGFEEFWKAYPRKVGKDAAAKAFARRKVGTDLLAQMLTAINSRKSSEAWRKNGGQFIPHPSTWLNEGRWKDEDGAGPSVEPDLADLFRRGASGGST